MHQSSGLGTQCGLWKQWLVDGFEIGYALAVPRTIQEHHSSATTAPKTQNTSLLVVTEDSCKISRFWLQKLSLNAEDPSHYISIPMIEIIKKSHIDFFGGTRNLADGRLESCETGSNRFLWQFVELKKIVDLSENGFYIFSGWITTGCLMFYWIIMIFH